MKNSITDVTNSADRRVLLNNETFEKANDNDWLMTTSIVHSPFVTIVS